jgi:DNA repair protein RadD
VHGKAWSFGRRELVIIDEAHLVSDRESSMYAVMLSELLADNPRLRVVGLTATPYRTGEGPLCGIDKTFQRIVYESQTGRLIEEGFLCPITNKQAENSVDTTEIKQRGGEFIAGEMARAFESGDNVTRACAETVERCTDRKSVLIFSAGVNHAEEIAAIIERLTGEKVGVVTGDTFPMERAETLRRFRNQDLRWLVNCDVLTTGFDSPCIDAIAVMRATLSPGLFCQMVGRGLRKHEGKENCLILDFGGNIARHGSLDDPEYGRSSAKRQGVEIAVEKNGRGKQCEQCKQDVAPNCRFCPDCGYTFSVKHDGESDGKSTLTGEEPPETFSVVTVRYSEHVKKTDNEAPTTLRVDYECQPLDGGGNLAVKHISEWVCFNHEGFARTKAGLWWQCRSTHPEPVSVDEAIDLLTRGVGRVPATITVKREGKYKRIVSVEFVDERPDESEWLEAVDESERVEFSGFESDVPF